MNTFLTVVTLLVLGINISAACNTYGMKTCLKSIVDCGLAAECERAAMACGRTEQCYKDTQICQNSFNALTTCSSSYSCTPPFSYKYLVQDSCMPMSAATSVSRLTVFTGFSAITVSLLAYFSKE